VVSSAVGPVAQITFNPSCYSKLNIQIADANKFGDGSYT
jgi:hypothetical protein